jgi:DNA-binding transcriptional ArsR family regulator
MRLDVPQELPRRRELESAPSAPGLDASPVERRRESLAARAADRRPMPQAPPSRPRQPDRTHKPVSPSITPRDHRPGRDAIPQQTIGLSLREEERKVLAEVGRFRVVRTSDLSEAVYGNRHSRMERDLTFLREKGLVQIDSVNARRDGRSGRVERIEVVSLTKGGQSLVRLTGGLPQDQKLYSGLVKPREIEHDAQIYRAYRKEADRIEQRGGTNLRVKLDFELKSDVQKAIHAARKTAPEREMAEIKQQIAQQFELPYVNDAIQIPDARIEYDMDQGSRTGHEDIEVLTAAYHAGHLRAKAQAGFRNYASASDRATITAKIEDHHYLIENILEL